MNRWILVTYEHVDSRIRSHIDELRMEQCAVANTSAKVGDDVLLWRYGQGGGLVAAGTICDAVPIKESHQSFRMHQYLAPHRSSDLVYVKVELKDVFLDNPIPPDVLYRKGLINVWYVARDLANKVGDNVAEKSAELARVELREEDWRDLISEATKRRDIAWPATWSIPSGSIVRRAQLHSLLGGNPRISCSASAKTPNIFLFLYRDFYNNDIDPYWEHDVLVTPGHFQWGSGTSQENIALLTHMWRGRPLRVFESSIDDACYMGEFVIDQSNPVERWEFTGEEKAVQGSVNPRREPEKRQVPLVRLKKLSGLDWPFDSGGPFKDAPRVELGLQLTVTDTVQEGPSTGNGNSSVRSGTDLKETIHSALSHLEHDPEIAKTVGVMDEAQALAALVQHVRRQSDISSLRSAVENTSTTEHDLQKYLDRMTWIFGGEFISRAKRRALTAQDELDIALVRPDGTLHGVEIKQAYIPKLVKKQNKNHLIVGRAVNEAVGQAMNYLRSLDEQHDQIMVNFGIDCRRASMTVLIGYTPFADLRVGINEIDEAIRTYNSHMTRVRVMTYDHLLDAAQRVLDLAEPFNNNDPVDN